MTRRVFLSHHSSDVEMARAVRLDLEQHGFVCWMAPDSVTGGRSWPEQIVAAIKDCDAVVVLVSSASNASSHVSKEVELAVGNDKKLLPVRVADVAPSGNLEYLLALAQWTDAFPGSIDRYLGDIRRRVAEAFEDPSQGLPPVATAATSAPRGPDVAPSRRGRVLGALAVLLVIAAGVGIAAGLGDQADDPTEATGAAIATTTATQTTAAPAVSITNFGPTGAADPDGCVTLGWSVEHAEQVSLVAPDGSLQRVEAEDEMLICGQTGDVAALRCEAADGSVATAEYVFAVDLIVESVETDVRGRTLLVDVITNQAADITVSLLGRTAEKTSTGKSVHHLEFGDQASGPVEWRVVATRADLADAVAGGTTAIPYYSMRVSVVEGPSVVTTTTTSTTTTTTVAAGTVPPALIVIGTVDLTPVPIIINPDLLQVALGYWFTYAAQPIPAYFGRVCETSFAGDAVDELLVPTESDGSSEVVVSVDWCPPDGSVEGPLPSHPDSGQVVSLGPGFDPVSSEVLLSFPMNDVAIEVRLLVERISTEEPPDND